MLKSILAGAGLAMAASAAAAPDHLDGDKMICKPVNGLRSRIATEQVCRTRAEWAAIAKDTQRRHDNYGRTGSQGTIGPPRPVVPIGTRF
jgi:hypothetical protein